MPNEPLDAFDAAASAARLLSAHMPMSAHAAAHVRTAIDELAAAMAVMLRVNRCAAVPGDLGLDISATVSLAGEIN